MWYCARKQKLANAAFVDHAKVNFCAMPLICARSSAVEREAYTFVVVGSIPTGRTHLKSLGLSTEYTLQKNGDRLS